MDVLLHVLANLIYAWKYVARDGFICFKKASCTYALSANRLITDVIEGVSTFKLASRGLILTWKYAKEVGNRPFIC